MVKSIAHLITLYIRIRSKTSTSSNQDFISREKLLPICWQCTNQ